MKKLQVKYAQRKEPDYLLYEILSILIEARTKIRNKNAGSRYESMIQNIVDQLYAELKAM